MLIYLLKVAEEERFKVLGFVCVGFGMLANFFFHGATVEHESPSKTKPKDKVTAKDWLNFNPFWQIALTYTCSRLVVNVSAVYTASLSLSLSFLFSLFPLSTSPTQHVFLQLYSFLCNQDGEASQSIHHAM